MKKIILKYVNYLYFLSLLVILILYLFPGDIVSYFIHSNYEKNINPIQNPIAGFIHSLLNTGGYSFNHVLTFSFITGVGLLTYFKEKNFYLALFFFIFFSIFLELLHFIVPNRAFELSDLISNLIGVIIVLFIFKKLKK
tara:strand:- start:568 stop:984 length:417 start_codon:yes stop_codon:yes gene_type:complete